MKLPEHIAIIMDGNGRWAQRRFLPRVAGHQQGLESVRSTVTAAIKQKIPYLTLFTFSSENWRRPQFEIDFLFGILLRSLKNELRSLHENGIKIKIIGDKSVFSEELKEVILNAEELTANNTTLQLNIAFNYGGRWDILQATRDISEKVAMGELKAEEISETVFEQHLCFADCPEPDLLIRTSGEYRISNFLLWQLAYTEFYFTDIYWPDFREAEFEKALEAFARRERRFGHHDTRVVSTKNNVQDPIYNRVVCSDDVCVVEHIHA